VEIKIMAAQYVLIGDDKSLMAESPKGKAKPSGKGASDRSFEVLLYWSLPHPGKYLISPLGQWFPLSFSFPRDGSWASRRRGTADGVRCIVKLNM